MQKMPKVVDCTVEECAYNKNESCHALAITIGDMQSPHCDTFLRADSGGGVEDATAGVGACKTSACQYNRKFECSAGSIQVGMIGNEPDCLTYEPM